MYQSFIDMVLWGSTYSTEALKHLEDSFLETQSLPNLSLGNVNDPLGNHHFDPTSTFENHHTINLTSISTLSWGVWVWVGESYFFHLPIEKKNSSWVLLLAQAGK